MINGPSPGESEAEALKSHVGTSCQLLAAGRVGFFQALRFVSTFKTGMCVNDVTVLYLVINGTLYNNFSPLFLPFYEALCVHFRLNTVIAINLAYTCVLYGKILNKSV